MKPIPLFGSGISSISPFITSQRRLNCFWDFRADQDKSNAVLIGTFGLVVWLSLPTYPIRGWKVVGNFLYAVGGSSLYKISKGGVVNLLGNISPYTTKVSMDSNGAELIIVDGVGGFVVTIATDVITTITDPNFPYGATTISFLDGRFIANLPNSRQFFVGQSYAGLVWTPVVYGTKENYSDQLLAVDVQNGLLMLWGQTSIEFWQDVGASPLPYSRVQGATATYGLGAVYSKLSVNNTMIFLGVGSSGSIQIVQLQGTTPAVISTSDVDDILEDISRSSTYSDAVASSYTIYGHVFYQITFPSAKQTLLYDSKTGLWQETQTGLDLIGRHLAELGVSFNASNYVSDSSTGNIYYYSEVAYTDNTMPIKRQMVSKHINKGGDVFPISEVYLDMERGTTPLQSGQGSDPQISVETSKDNGNTFGTPRFTSIGMTGQYKSPRVGWRIFGRSDDFVFRFTMTDPVPFRVTRAMALM